MQPFHHSRTRACRSGGIGRTDSLVMLASFQLSNQTSRICRVRDISHRNWMDSHQNVPGGSWLLAKAPVAYAGLDELWPMALWQECFQLVLNGLQVKAIAAGSRWPLQCERKNTSPHECKRTACLRDPIAQCTWNRNFYIAVTRDQRFFSNFQALGRCKVKLVCRLEWVSHAWSYFA